MGPDTLNPTATQSKNPTITWIEDSTRFYWVFAWNEFNSSYAINVMYTYSYGCTL